MTQIRLRTEKDREVGFPILLRSGSVVYTDERDKYIVPEESIEKLKKADVHYEIEPIRRNGTG